MQSLVISRRRVDGFEVYRNQQGLVQLTLQPGERRFYFSMSEAEQLGKGVQVILPEGTGSLLHLREEEIGDDLVHGFDLREDKADGAVYVHALSCRDGGKLCEALLLAGQP